MTWSHLLERCPGSSAARETAQSRGRGLAGLLRLVGLLLVLVTVAPAGALGGCRHRAPGPGEQAGDGNSTQPGAPTTPSQTGVLDEAVLWVWPPDPESEADAVSSLEVFFRFRDAPAAGSLQAGVTPDTTYHLYYNGDIVTVLLDQLLPGRVHEVTLAETASGRPLARTHVAAGRGDSYKEPYVTVSVGRERLFPGGGSEGQAGPVTDRLEDGATVLATFEDVIVDIFVPGDVSEEAMRAAVSPEPAEVIYNYSRDWCGGSVLQVRWPG